MKNNGNKRPKANNVSNKNKNSIHRSINTQTVDLILLSIDILIIDSVLYCTLQEIVQARILVLVLP